jgi:Bacterial regulatory protein, arsR family
MTAWQSHPACWGSAHPNRLWLLVALLAGGEMCVCDLAAVTGMSGGRASDQAERRVLQIIAVTFFVLATYVVVASVIELAARAHPGRLPAGIGRTISSLLVMPLLGWRKRRAGTALRN